MLRGDAAKIRIKKLNAAGSIVEIIVPYHARRPIDADPKLQSNRVDIGVVLYNGTHYSAPGFVTFYSLDSEARTYDAEGRAVEIGYGAGETVLTVSNWQALFDLLPESNTSLPAKFLRQKLNAEQASLLAKVADAYRGVAGTAQVAAEQASKLANEAKQKVQNSIKVVEEQHAAAQKALDAEKNDVNAEALSKTNQAVTDAQQALKVAETAEQAARTALDAANNATTAALARPRRCSTHC